MPLCLVKSRKKGTAFEKIRAAKKTEKKIQTIPAGAVALGNRENMPDILLCAVVFGGYISA